MAEGVGFLSNKQKQELWNERIKDFRASGLSQKAWCEQEGFNAGQLGYWLRKLQAATEAPNHSRWVNIEAIAPSGSGISLRIGNVVLEVERGFDQKVLADVVRSLMPYANWSPKAKGLLGRWCYRPSQSR